MFFSMFLLFSVTIANAQFLKKIGQSIKKEIKKVEKETDRLLKKNDTHSNKNENKTNDAENINFKEGLEFKAPNNDFSKIILQKYNGLPRFGTLTSHGNNTGKKFDSETKNRLSEILNKDNDYQQRYLLMIETKYLSKNFDDVERNVFYKSPTVTEDLSIKKHKNFQGYIQNFIKKIAYRTVSDIGKKKYFFNENETQYDGGSQEWGGRGADEFMKMEAYQNFLDESLESLKDWSKEFFLNDEADIYYVETIGIDKYDFEKQGYFINISVEKPIFKLDTRLTGDYSQFGTYQPQNEYEMGIKDEGFNKILFEMPISEAKNLKEKLSFNGISSRKVAYAVRKLKLKATKQRNLPNNVFQKQEFTFSIASPIIEIYSDEDLSDKIGIINYESILEKQRLIAEKEQDEKKQEYESKSKQVLSNKKLDQDREYNLTEVDVFPVLNGCESVSYGSDLVNKCIQDKILEITQEVFFDNDYIFKSKYTAILRISKQGEITMSTDNYTTSEIKNQIRVKVSSLKITPAKINQQPVNCRMMMHIISK